MKFQEKNQIMNDDSEEIWKSFFSGIHNVGNHSDRVLIVVVSGHAPLRLRIASQSISYSFHLYIVLPCGTRRSNSGSARNIWNGRVLDEDRCLNNKASRCPSHKSSRCLNYKSSPCLNHKSS